VVTVGRAHPRAEPDLLDRPRRHPRRPGRGRRVLQRHRRPSHRAHVRRARSHEPRGVELALRAVRRPRGGHPDRRHAADRDPARGPADQRALPHACRRGRALRRRGQRAPARERGRVQGCARRLLARGRRRL
ncbi:MAG: hypothetical protein AVDCRST_MAG85-460, partial [uncultured Solirubrobacteraceae bacterium]